MCHASLGPDALRAFEMNKSNGGKQRRQHDTVIPESNPVAEHRRATVLCRSRHICSWRLYLTKLRHVGTTKISQKFGGFPNTVGKTSEHVFSTLLTILSLIPSLISCQKFPFRLNKVCRLCLSGTVPRCYHRSFRLRPVFSHTGRTSVRD